MGVGDAIINESVAWRRGYLVVAGRRLGRKTGIGRQAGQAASQPGQADQPASQAGQAGRQSVNQAGGSLYNLDFHPHRFYICILHSALFLSLLPIPCLISTVYTLNNCMRRDEVEEEEKGEGEEGAGEGKEQSYSRVTALT